MSGTPSKEGTPVKKPGDQPGGGKPTPKPGRDRPKDPRQPNTRPPKR